MSYRLTKIYTRKGDDGTTSLDAKHRLLKNSLRIEAIGTIDELNSAIGVVLASPLQHTQIKEALVQIQQNLFNLGGELCPPHRSAIDETKTIELEQLIDEWNKALPPLKEFILPGGNLASAHCHLARTICRRAERCLVALYQEESFNPEILKYTNRLSDLLFVAARVLNTSPEVLWQHDKKV